MHSTHGFLSSTLDMDLVTNAKSQQSTTHTLCKLSWESEIMAAALPAKPWSAHSTMSTRGHSSFHVLTPFCENKYVGVHGRVGFQYINQSVAIQ
jgi:hypothetical protein